VRIPCLQDGKEAYSEAGAAAATGAITVLQAATARAQEPGREGTDAGGGLVPGDDDPEHTNERPDEQRQGEGKVLGSGELVEDAETDSACDARESEQGRNESREGWESGPDGLRSQVIPALEPPRQVGPESPYEANKRFEQRKW
jgi:hypothetical protein